MIYSVEELLPAIHAQKVFYQCFSEEFDFDAFHSAAKVLQLVAEAGSRLERKLEAQLATNTLYYHSFPHQKRKSVVRKNPKIISLRLSHAVFANINPFEHRIRVSLFVYFK